MPAYYHNWPRSAVVARRGSGVKVAGRVTEVNYHRPTGFSMHEALTA